MTSSRNPARLRIATSAILLAWILGFFARVRSREQLGRWLDRRAVQKLVGGHVSSDTLGRVLDQIDPKSLRARLLVPVVRELRRNKAWQGGTVHTQLLVGIDGSEPFSSRHQRCPDCHSRQVSVRRGREIVSVTEYFHQAVWAFIVGTSPRVYLDVEPVLPGEGESTASIRLATRLVQQYGRWLDGFVVDANFAGAPFLNHVRSLDRHYIVRVKDEERRHLTQDAGGLTRKTPATTWSEPIGPHHLRVQAWDEEGFASWEGLQEPVRVVICDETELPEAPYRRRLFPKPERQRPRAFFATSYSQSVMPTHEIWLAYHRRWDIENNGIRQLKHEWHWNHAFVHTPTALENLWLLMAVAANLFVAFVHRRLRSGRTAHVPMRTYAEAIAAALLFLPYAAMPAFNTS